MGYYTSYELVATGFKDETEAEFFEFKLRKLSGYSGWEAETTAEQFKGVLQEVKWYNHKADVDQLSTEFPHVTIDVNGVGEGHGDIWKMRARNGQIERVEAEIKFPEFNILT